MLHFTISSFNYSKPFRYKQLALMCCNHLMQAHREKRAFIEVFCLMPDHLHLCLQDRRSEAIYFVDRWKSFVTNESWKLGWTGRLWHSCYLIKETCSQAAEQEVIEYVLQNPVKAGLVSMWKEWPYWAEPPYGRIGWADLGEAVPGLAPRKKASPD